MNINVIFSNGELTQAWHINPTDCTFRIGLDGSLTIEPKDSAWQQIIWGLEVDTNQQIDPTMPPWPEILRRVSERAAAGNKARRLAAEAGA